MTMIFKKNWKKSNDCLYKSANSSLTSSFMKTIKKKTFKILKKIELTIF